jgi:hypothetical protein
MNKPTLIVEAAKAFKAASDEYEKARTQMEDLEIDVKLAVRAGYPAAAAEQARDEYRNKTWGPAYRARSKAGKALAEAIGVAPNDLKYSL